MKGLFVSFNYFFMSFFFFFFFLMFIMYLETYGRGYFVDILLIFSQNLYIYKLHENSI